MARTRAKKRKGRGRKSAAGAASSGRERSNAAGRGQAAASGSAARDSRPAAGSPARSRRRWLATAAVVAFVGAAVLALARRAQPGPAAERGGGAAQPSADGRAALGPAERLRVHVLRRLPHQRDAFTQGLVWHDGELYESTGLNGESSLRLVDLDTGQVLRRRDLDPALFAEGLALVGDLLYQITYQDQRAFVYRRGDFRPVGEHSYEGEGWGLCYDGAHLVMSDGSDRLSFRDPESFSLKSEVRVREGGRPLSSLNELECVEGAVWANVWKEDRLVRIDPSTGRVTAVADAAGLLTADERIGTDVLNGIAWMPESRHFLITGKNWPWLFEVTFDPIPAPGSASPR